MLDSGVDLIVIMGMVVDIFKRSYYISLFVACCLLDSFGRVDCGSDIVLYVGYSICTVLMFSLL